MRTALAALAGASAAFAAYSPDSYSDNSPPAYGSDGASASSSTSAYATGTSSSLASPASGTPDFPSCWTSCFKEAGVKSPEETCDDADLTKCIEKSCSSEEADKYNSWLAKECGSTSSASSSAVSTSSSSASTSSSVVGPTGSSSYSHGPSGYLSSSSLSGYPHGPSSYPAGSSGWVPSSSGSPGGYGNCTTTYSSVCTETETLIYRSTTEYAPTTITHIFTTSLPSGSCASVPYPITSSSSVPTSPEESSSVPVYPGGYDTSSSPSSPEQPSSSSPSSPEQPTGYGSSSSPSSPEQPTGYGSSSSPSSPEQPSSSSPSSPEQPTGYTTVTDLTTVYTTVCPATETHESEGQTVTSVYQTTSEVTETYQTTVVVTPTSPASPAGPTGSELPSGPAGGNQGVPSEYTSIRPVTKPYTYGEWTSVYTDFETVTLTSYVTAVETEGSPVPTGGSSPSEGSPTGGHLTTQTQTYETEITTAYTTVCPATESDGVTTDTITTTSTVSLTFTVTTTDYPESTSSSVGGPGSLPPYPTPSNSNSPPTGFPTGSGVVPSGSVSSSSPAGPTDTGSPQPPIPDCWAKCFAANNITSERDLCGDVGTETCIKAECSMDSYNAYEGWLDDYCGVASTSSAVVGPTGGSGYPQPTGSGSPHPTGTGAPHPTGTGAPHPTGTGSPTSSSTCAAPQPTKNCKRCEGQSGDDKFCGFDINTNIYKEGNAPITCDTVEYDWDITTGPVSPDGVERIAILVNGQSPGPAIEANWGDEIIVRVKNSMPKDDLNGTTIHWHGIHQKGTPEFDGVPSLSQCPIAPGETFTYKFRATQYGSSWYHSHFALQAYDGLFGPMIIHGPVQEGYEYDGEEFIAIQDWRHAPLTEIYHNLELVSNGQRSSPTLDNGLINGKNTWENGGERWSMTVTKGKTYRLRVLNAAVQSTFKFYIDGHSFKVIAADFVPIEPFETNIININNGQRYDVIFTADQPSANYWMRSDVQAPCSNVTNGLDIKAIVHYDDAPTGEPTSEAYQYTPECIDEPAANLVPIVPWNAGASSDEIDKDVLIQPNGGNPNLFKWTLSGTAFFSQWGDPTLQSIYDDGTVPTYSGDLAIREDNLGEWIYVVIDSVIPLPHPIHLHGHDFLVLGQGVGPYNPASAALNLINPPRRDTAIMPFQLGPGAVGGYLVVAFYTDNPGVWLMHCHIGWVSPSVYTNLSRKSIC